MATERAGSGKGTGKAKKKTARGKRGARQTAAALAIEKRREQATKLKLAGWSYRDIAAHLKCSLGTVASDIGAVLQRAQEKSEDYIERERAISVARLEKAVQGIWPNVESGELDAVDRLVRIEARRARTIGFEAPEKRELTGKDGGPIKTQSVADLLALADED